MQQQPPKLQSFTNEPVLKAVWTTMTIVAVIAAFATLYLLLRVELSQQVKTWLALTWFIGPPAWFLFENTVLLHAEDVELKKERMARFRLAQDSARMCWFGVAAAIIYLTKSA
jgi:hypothetical protein